MCVFYKYWKRLLVKRLLVKKTFQFCIDYESHKYMLRILFYKKIRRAYHQLQLEACYILLHPKLKIKFCTRWNPNWLENYMPNYLCYLTVNLYLSSLFYYDNSVIINMFKRWITIPVCFRNWKISFIQYTSLEFNDWPFGVIVTRHFRPKPGHLNEGVYQFYRL